MLNLQLLFFLATFASLLSSTEDQVFTPSGLIVFRNLECNLLPALEGIAAHKLQQVVLATPLSSFGIELLAPGCTRNADTALCHWPELVWWKGVVVAMPVLWRMHWNNVTQ